MRERTLLPLHSRFNLHLKENEKGDETKMETSSQSSGKEGGRREGVGIFPPSSTTNPTVRQDGSGSFLRYRRFALKAFNMMRRTNMSVSLNRVLVVLILLSVAMGAAFARQLAMDSATSTSRSDSCTFYTQIHTFPNPYYFVLFFVYYWDTRTPLM